MSHTPGPWEARRLEPDGFLIRQYGWEIRTPAWDVATWIEHGGPIRKEEDALVIAAAPDLLEACEAEAVLWRHYIRCPKCAGTTFCPDATMMAATASSLRAIALAKARGKSNA